MNNRRAFGVDIVAAILAVSIAPIQIYGMPKRCFIDDLDYDNTLIQKPFCLADFKMEYKNGKKAVEDIFTLDIANCEVTTINDAIFIIQDINQLVSYTRDNSNIDDVLKKQAINYLNSLKESLMTYKIDVNTVWTWREAIYTITLDKEIGYEDKYLIATLIELDQSKQFDSSDINETLSKLETYDLDSNTKQLLRKKLHDASSNNPVIVEKRINSTQNDRCSCM